MTYKYFEHTADVIFEAYGKTLEEMFESAALATEEVMVNLKTLKVKETKLVKLEGRSVEDLLYLFLEELIFIKDTEGLLFKEFKIKIKDNKLDAVCKGEKINSQTQELEKDLKAVTMHQFEVKEEKGKWKARVLLDI